MKNKILFLGSLCLVLALGLVFTGCDDKAQLVEFATIESPGSVIATYSAVNDQLTVTWNAVDGAGGYDVVASQSGKTTYIVLGEGNIVSIASAYPNVDKWEGVFTRVSRDYKGKWKIGVVAISRRLDRNNSNPAWASGTFDF